MARKGRVPHLLVDISAHGFGHLAQVVPVLQALLARSPRIRLTLRTSLPEGLLRARLGVPFRFLPARLDVGLPMAGPLRVEVEEAARAYQAFHRDWEGQVRQEASRLGALAPDLVLADVPYLSLAAASAAGIAGVAMSSLHWGEIFRAYFRDLPASARVHREILDAYRAAELFIQLTPHMPMTDLPRRRSVGPVASRGANRRCEIEARFGLGDAEQLVLLALGGVPASLPLERWPLLPGVRWLAPVQEALPPQLIPLTRLPMPFVDLVASSDVVVTKPGYGTFVEAAAHGRAVLFLARPDWPESPYLIRWLEASTRCREIGWSELESGAIADALEALRRRPAPPRPALDGAEEAAEVLLGLLGQT